MKTQETESLKYLNSEFHYLVIGNGENVILGFHGFSENASSFSAIESVIDGRFRIIALDFPFHGQTKWNEKREFHPDDLAAVIGLLQTRYSFNDFGAIGYSMGGKVVLKLMENNIALLKNVFLIAPDGINTHKIFDIAVYPAWGRFLFRRVMKNPKIFLSFVRLLFRTGRISKFLYEFTFNHIDTIEKRERIYLTWMSLKNFDPDLDTVKSLVAKSLLPLHLIYGRNDQVIKASSANKFINGLDSCTLDILPKGHKLLDADLKPVLDKYLLV